MERALNLAGFELALGQHDRLPSPNEFQALIAEAEVGLFINRHSLTDDLLKTGWYLHGIASAPEAMELYAPDRQRRAFQVSSHVFDLALADERRPLVDRLRLTFAAQVGYRESGLEPNAMAMYSRVKADVGASTDLLDHVGSMPLEAGVALMGAVPRSLFATFRQWLAQFEALRQQIGVDELGATSFGTAWGVCAGAQALLKYLTLGDQSELDRADGLLDRAARAEGQLIGDLDARWVASHLRRAATRFRATSVWTALPSHVSPATRRALTLTSPPVLTLWEPQMRLLSSENETNPLDPEVRRALLAVPTSAGKTLTAQIIMLAHLASSPTSACFVAPMRSLGREVRAAMRSRLGLLRRELGRDLPDYADWGIEQEDVDPAGVDIMTPERLMHLLRRDPDAVLARYSLFIFDEVHMLAESGRGPILEQTIAFLHWRTLGTHHRIILLSAAIGNRGEVMGWLDPNGDGESFYSDWRGPRRLHAIYSTEILRDTSRREQVAQARTRFDYRNTFDLRGVIRLRAAREAGIARFAFVDPVGHIAFRETEAGQRDPAGKEGPHSTAAYETAAHIAAAVEHAGPVLVVMSSRVLARQMARAIATLADRRPGTRALTASVRDRLGRDHPLVEVLPHGVGFHHGGLPTDILESLEDALRAGTLGWMVATSTLTEGVNLPVRTVVIAETRYEGQPLEAQLRGARLVNAMGRAGRATRESEGWVVLCLQARERDSDFELLSPSDEQLEVRSQLAVDGALNELGDFEELLTGGEDAVFAVAQEHVREFISYIWFVLASEEGLGRAPASADLEGALQRLFGFTQLNDPSRRRWRQVASTVRDVYDSTEIDSRRAWSRAGTSVGSARELHRLARSLAGLASETSTETDLLDPAVALTLAEEAGFFEAVFALPESPHQWGFRKHANAPLVSYVDPLTLAKDWLGGRQLPAMASAYLAAVTAPDFRIEQMVDTVTELFEHYLSWVFAVVVEATNVRLASSSEDRQVCPDLPLFMRYGVDSPVGLSLAIGGVSSRRLLHDIARRAQDYGRENAVEEWLASMSMEDWRDEFSPTPSELLDLLELTRTKRGSLLADFLEVERAELEVDPSSDMTSTTQIPVLVDYVPSDPQPARIGVFSLDGQLLATVRAPEHAAVDAILATGLDRSAVLIERQLQILLTE